MPGKLKKINLRNLHEVSLFFLLPSLTFMVSQLCMLYRETMNMYLHGLATWGWVTSYIKLYGGGSRFFFHAKTKKIPPPSPHINNDRSLSVSFPWCQPVSDLFSEPRMKTSLCTKSWNSPWSIFTVYRSLKPANLNVWTQSNHWEPVLLGKNSGNLTMRCIYLTVFLLFFQCLFYFRKSSHRQIQSPHWC